MSVKLGKITKITNTQIGVDLDTDLSTSYIIRQATPIRVGGTGNYIKVNKLVYQIDNEQITDLNENDKSSTKVSIKRTLICNLVGYFAGDYFKIGSDGTTPNLFDNVYTLTNEEIILVYTNA